ncbi:A-kinase-interacting protein 1 isoform X2 [Camelus dromedarius]|uniref:A-kinase-interacting protein 1 isoform X2 n=1 Tax=Camelus dromedarius TaxID=9838 RepID=UPI001263353A|nr:A-kinase-interacting protein 1 isoform X2 [Camelus dromedarius]
MENCLAAAALNGLDRRSLQRSAKLGQEVLERAKRRAVDWHSVELPKGSAGVISRERPYRERGPAAGTQRLLPGEREERHPTLSASFRTMAEFMDYTSSQCGKYYSSAPEEGGAIHVSRYHRGKSSELCLDIGNDQRKDASRGVGGICLASDCALEAPRPVSAERLGSWASPPLLVIRLRTSLRTST